MSTVTPFKVVKSAGHKASEFETKVVEEIVKIQNSGKDFANALNGLYILAAKEIQVAGDKAAIVLFVPYPLRKSFQKIQSRLIPELEKKFEGRPVVIVAKRTVLSKHCNRAKNLSGPRPRSRTLTAVQDALLDDIVYPTEIVGKRTIIPVNAPKTLKVILDNANQADVELKLDAFSTVYKALTTKKVVFEFAPAN